MPLECGLGAGTQPKERQIDVTHKRMENCDDVDEYSLHDRCAFTTIDSWEAPY